MHTFEHLRVNPERPQLRQIRRAAELLRQGLFVAVPTDTTYALMCRPDATNAVAAIKQFKKLNDSHLWAVACADLTMASTCVRLDNGAHRILKRCLPGPYTFILPANASLPRRIFAKRKDVGVRMPDHPICQMLLEACGDVLLTTTLSLPNSDEPAYDPDEFIPHLKHLGCVILDGGWGGLVPTTVVDLCGDEALILRAGAGVWPA
ncbi:MAG: L-threonylcarbamoyladenylate synthase [Mariprofundus sp.]|nr:L-threonylcarbamoyladenylate synthase [Mariprofundus sp.]